MRILNSVALFALLIIPRKVESSQPLNSIEIITTLNGQPFCGPEVTIDGKWICEAPCELQLSLTPHDVEIFIDDACASGEAISASNLKQRDRTQRLHLQAGPHPEPITFSFRSP